MIPLFYLYGEPHRAVDEHFIHAEALDDRTRPSEWTIRPHAHADLHHIFHVAAGGGAMRAETAVMRFAAPCLLAVPAGVIHGFTWDVESHGSVVTLSAAYLDEIARHDRDLGTLFLRARVASLGATENGDVGRRVASIMRELGWAGEGHRTAIRAETLGLLVVLLRAEPMGETAAQAVPGRHAELVARFRDRVEKQFRRPQPIAAYAADLGASVRQLREACHHVARQAPSRMIDHRVILEAKRALLYTNLPINDIAGSLGFSDPAYFSRFFARNAGCPARDFRAGLAKVFNDQV